jgi:hypothetical protein
MRNWVTANIEPLSDRPVNSVKPSIQQKVKIAIIDSGVMKSDWRIRAALRGKKIKAGRNFVPTGLPDDWDDQVGVGHGTIVTSLLLDLAPNAELYIAKVTDGLDIRGDQVYCIGKVRHLIFFLLIFGWLRPPDRNVQPGNKTCLISYLPDLSNLVPQSFTLSVSTGLT